MAMSIGTMAQGSAFLTTNPVGWVLLGAQILRALFTDVPDAWGTAVVKYGPGITDLIPQVDATGESFGVDRVRVKLTNTLAQLDAIESGVSGKFERLVLERVGHSPQLDARDEVVASIAAFVLACATI